MQSGRECEGYEKYPTFVNRTAKGLEKRQRLEEIKPKIQTPVSDQPLDAFRDQRRINLFRYATGARDSSALSQVDNTQIYEQQIIARFLDVYSPPTLPGRPPSWFHLVPPIQGPGITLRYAIKAAAASRIAFVNNDENMRLRAFDAYGKALRELQKALWDPVAMYHDETLAAARALVFFEVRPTPLRYVLVDTE